MSNNSLFVSPLAIHYMLSQMYKTIEFDETFVSELCADCMINHIKDINVMIDFKGIGVDMSRQMVKIPCNVFRILDAYDEDDNPLNVYNNGAYLYNITDKYGEALDDGDTVYLNYKGIPVDEDGIVMIPEWQKAACETYCKIKLTEEMVGMGKFDKQLWMLWNQQLPGQCVAARSQFRMRTRKDLDDFNIVRYNMVHSGKIGDLPIKQKMYN